MAEGNEKSFFHLPRFLKAPLILLREDTRRYIRTHDKVVSTVLAVLIGVAVAYAAILFRQLILQVQDFALENRDENILSHVLGLAWWKILLVTTSGGLAVALIYRFFLREDHPYSFVEVIEANALNHTRIPTTKGLISAISAAVALGTGSAAGREGPVVHLGATIASWFAQRLHLSDSVARTILGCGVAAATSASFNAPIAGVFFALEVVLGHYALHAFAPIVIASVTAAIISRIHLGDYPAFLIPDYHITSFYEFPAFIILGVVSAAAAIIFIKSIFFTEDIAGKMMGKARLPDWSRPIFGGFAVGLLGIACPYILGVGYGSTDSALKEAFPLTLLLTLIVAKTAATSISLAFRYGTGVFSPSLFLGAMVGGAFGIIATHIAPELSGNQGLYAIVGMGAVCSAVLGAPISTILIVFELTGDYQITAALMVAVVMSNLITHHYLKASSFFHLQMKAHGVDLEGGMARHLMRTSHVRELIRDDYATVGEDAGIERIRELILEKGHNKLFVIDSAAKIVGKITFSELRKHFLKQEARRKAQEESKAEAPAEEEKPARAADICREVSEPLTPSDTLEHANDLFDHVGEEILPVVSDDAHREIIGIVHLEDVLKRYNKALLEDQEK
ncbi:chloride channel protein [Emcibacter sp.]|uniref:chloride channel protein n=1 Tax=Emcibacter sp. TaxID=1979954 RepID=UPI002AA87A72|nr:chloride channel protein [Emcibacter sp.]